MTQPNPNDLAAKLQQHPSDQATESSDDKDKNQDRDHSTKDDRGPGTEEFQSDDSKRQVLGDLQNERGKRRTAEKQINELRAELEKLKPAPKGKDGGERSETEQLQDQLKELTDRFQQAEKARTRLETASDFKIGKDYLPLLTADDPDDLREQAELVAALIKQVNEAAGEKAKNGGGSNLPGQGQGSVPSDLDTQIRAAEAKGDRELSGRLKLQKLQKLATS